VLLAQIAQVCADRKRFYRAQPCGHGNGQARP
jgi:hypothetical protein